MHQQFTHGSHGNKNTHTNDERLEKLIGPEGIARWKKIKLLNCSTNVPN